MHSREIRSGFLKFFESHRHRIVASSSLVPVDDPTLLFTNAGMNQFKDVFLGRERRDYTRATTSQKCMRVSGKHNDLDNVGPSLRHHTFFEMLGNFSFGDYFKAEAIELAWAALTKVWGLPADRLHATVFCGEHGIPRDGDAYDLWTRFLPTDRIAELGLADNFWQMGETGPSGRCSEIHYFRGDDIPCAQPSCKGIACDCDRFVEIWNNVFMEFDRQADGTLRPLPAPSIDTGMGLERLTAVIQGTLSNYDTDLFEPLLASIGELTGHRYGAGAAADVSMRVVADHIRATTFLIADGVVPSNEWRGYVLRKIMRRAMRHGKKLGARDPFLYRLVDVLVDEMGEQYPELRTGCETVVQAVRAEEERFDAVLTAGLSKLEDVLDRASAGARVVAGDEAFRLYDSLGVPIDFVEDLASERGLSVDREGFERSMEAQREKARAASAFELKKSDEFSFRSEAAELEVVALGDHFDGYTMTTVPELAVAAIFDVDRRQVDHLAEGETGYLVLPHTPFYVESGGQVSDVGVIRSETGAAATVVGMGRLAHGGPRVHRVTVTAGRFTEGDHVTAEVDAARRDATRRNHTATHLLHAALRRVLGTHVKQAGSLVAPDRLRFDFMHFAPISRDEVEAIEKLVNSFVYANHAVVTTVRPTSEAIADGATALFGEKYGDTVRVVSVPTVSLELCGGTHCRATGEIGLFSVVSEGGIAAGVRRIEAATGGGAVEHVLAQSRLLGNVVQTLGSAPDQAVPAIERLQAEVKRLAKEVGDLKVKAALGGGPARDDTFEVAGVRMLTRRLTGLDKTSMRNLADSLRDSLKSGVVVLASEVDDKVSLVVAVTKDLTGRVPAGQVVKAIAPIVGGAGGGRADFAEAGGKDTTKIDAALAESRQVVERLAAR